MTDYGRSGANDVQPHLGGSVAGRTVEYEFAGFRLRPASGELLRHDEPVKLGGRAFDLLVRLAEGGGELVDKRQLIAAAWPTSFVDEGSLRVHITALRRVLDRDGAESILNVPGRGYRLNHPIRQVRPESAVVVRPALPIVIGRSELVDRLATDLEARQAICLVGPGGIGKTTIALAAAEIWSRQRKADAIFIDLATAQNDEDVVSVAALSLGAALTGGDATADVIHHLSALDCLLIVDNCEHVILGAARLVEQIVALTGRSVLATSREALSIGERVWHIGPLSFPEGDQPTQAHEIMRFSAAQLLVERMRERDEAFDITDADAAAVAEICRRLDGMPLALELAAARAGAVGVPALLAALDQRFDLLTQGRRTALDRQRTLKGTIDWSYRLLSVEDQILFSRIAVFASTFTIEDVAGLLGIPPAQQVSLLDRVAGLVSKSLLTVAKEPREARYRMLETMRAYGRERLREMDLVAEVETAFAAHVETKVRGLGIVWTRAMDPGRRGEYSATLDDVRKALDWAFSPSGDARCGVSLTVASTPLWLHLALIAEFARRLRTALERLPDIDEDTRSSEIALQATLALVLFNLDGPPEEIVEAGKRGYALAQGAPLLDQLGPLLAWPNALTLLADHEAARDAAARFFDPAIALGDPDMVSAGMRMMAMPLTNLAQHDEAERLARGALSHLPGPAISSSLPVVHTASAASTRARALWQLGRVDEALAATELADAEGRKSMHPLSHCQILVSGVCPVTLWAGDLEAARRHIETLRSTSEIRNFPRWLSWARAYAVALEQLEKDASAAASGWRPPTRLHAENVGACHASLFDPDAWAPLDLPTRFWCTPEILRALAEQLMVTRAEGWRERAPFLLERSAEIALAQNALSWRLRTAATLAEFHEMTGERALARAVLEPVLNSFDQGAATRDVQRAHTLLTRIS